MSLRIEKVGHDWAVYDGSERLGPLYARRGQAEGRMSQIMTMRRKAAAKRRRPCMGCGNEFMSEGIHNRMCDRCRQYGAGLDTQMVG